MIILPVRTAPPEYGSRAVPTVIPSGSVRANRYCAAGMRTETPETVCAASPAAVCALPGCVAGSVSFLQAVHMKRINIANTNARNRFIVLSSLGLLL